jgi:hypothetical protein
MLGTQNRTQNRNQGSINSTAGAVIGSKSVFPNIPKQKTLKINPAKNVKNKSRRGYF